MEDGVLVNVKKLSDLLDQVNAVSELIGFDYDEDLRCETLSQVMNDLGLTREQCDVIMHW